MWLDGNTIWYYLFKSVDDAVGYLEHYLKTADLWEDPDIEIESSGLDCIWIAKIASNC